MKMKYLVIGAFILIIILSLGLYHDYKITEYNNDMAELQLINETYQITSIRTAEQYVSLQTGFQNESEIAACNYDLNQKYNTAGKCTLTSVAQQPNGDYIFSCECIVQVYQQS